MLSNEILNEIDVAHNDANIALQNRKFDSYISHFGDDLQYKQADGKTIGKEQLVKNIKNYFNRIVNFSGHYERKEFTIENDKVVERIIQHSKVSLRIFIFFLKNWTIEREGIYEWKKTDSLWKIIKVEILSEKVF